MLGEVEARTPPAPEDELSPSPPPLLRQAVAGVPLGALLERLVHALERAAPGLTASILVLVDGHLRLGAGPNLPEAYNRAADNLPVGEGFGSCGTAAHRGQLVVSPDLQVDPLWKHYRDIVRRYQLGSCWSMPILGEAGAVLGTLALYSRKPRAPSPHELGLMRDHADLAALAIQCHDTQAALTESELRRQELVDALEGIVWEAQADGRRFSYVSRQAEQLFGYPARRWLQEPGFWTSILHPEDREITLRRDREAASRPGPYESQYRLRTADGGTVWVRDTVSVRADRLTGARQVQGVMINITRQREAEVEREEAFQRVGQPPAPQPAGPTDHASPPAAVSPEERILIEAGTTLGTSLETDVIAHNLAGLVVPRLADWSLVLVATAEGRLRCAAMAHRDPQKLAARAEFDRLLDQPGGVPFHVNSLLDRGQGRLFARLPGEACPEGAVRPDLLRLVRELGAHSAVTAPLPARTGVVGALVCVSASPQRPYTERDLALAEELGRRGALALENARLFRDSQAAVRRREEFLSIAAHELMTPVASLLLTVQTILEALEQQPPDLEFLRGRAVAGERQGVRLGRLVNELLDVSRIRAGRLELIRADMDLAETVHGVVGRFREEIARKGIDVAVHAPAPAMGHWDQSRIEQIVSNLLSNAIKYGDQQPVLIAVGQDAERVTLEVADRGIGMDPAFLPRLFNPFERGVSAGHYGGLGLGLYIAAQNAEAHGGRISVRSVPGQGSTFTVELPRRAPD